VSLKIHQWENISITYRETIILGNGASIAISPRFSYASLLKHAIYKDWLTNDVHQLFNFFQTNDFELVLRLVWQASKVNQSLKIQDERTHQAYIRVRECLIQSIRDIHPEHNEIAQCLPNLYKYLKNFHTVISLNYDLIVYWAMTYGLSVDDQHSFKDCFLNGVFDANWQRFRNPIGRDRATTLVFYPHGSLILCRNVVEAEQKISGSGSDLLDSILNRWQSETVVPLFVSEGNKNQKINSICNSYYLSTVYREVLPSQKDDLTIYGWSFGEHDLHLLKKMENSGIRRVAISVFGGDQAYCNHACEIVRQYLGNFVHVDFFDSESAGF
jgi:hypothetical protein